MLSCGSCCWTSPLPPSSKMKEGVSLRGFTMQACHLSFRQQKSTGFCKRSQHYIGRAVLMDTLRQALLASMLQRSEAPSKPVFVIFSALRGGVRCQVFCGECSCYMASVSVHTSAQLFSFCGKKELRRHNFVLAAVCSDNRDPRNSNSYVRTPRVQSKVVVSYDRSTCNTKSPCQGTRSKTLHENRAA